MQGPAPKEMDRYSREWQDSIGLCKFKGICVERLLHSISTGKIEAVLCFFFGNVSVVGSLHK